MALSDVYLDSVEKRLSAFSPSLSEIFGQAARELNGALDDGELERWAEEGIGLAEHSLRSWEAAADYFLVGPNVLTIIDRATFDLWSQAGRDLAEPSAAIAGAYFRASPTSVPPLAGAEIAEWAGLGQRLYKGTWKSISLVSDFFSQSPLLFHCLSLGEIGRLVRILDGISERSADLAAACLESSISVFPRLQPQDRSAFLD